MRGWRAWLNVAAVVGAALSAGARVYVAIGIARCLLGDSEPGGLARLTAWGIVLLLVPVSVKLDGGERK